MITPWSEFAEFQKKLNSEFVRQSKPSLVFYNDGSYTGVRHGDVAIDDKLDCYNSYMDLLELPSFHLYRITFKRPEPYKPLRITY